MHQFNFMLSCLWFYMFLFHCKMFIKDIKNSIFRTMTAMFVKIKEDLMIWINFRQSQLFFLIFFFTSETIQYKSLIAIPINSLNYISNLVSLSIKTCTTLIYLLLFLMSDDLNILYNLFPWTKWIVLSVVSMILWSSHNFCLKLRFCDFCCWYFCYCFTLGRSVSCWILAEWNSVGMTRSFSRKTFDQLNLYTDGTFVLLVAWISVSNNSISNAQMEKRVRQLCTCSSRHL